MTRLSIIIPHRHNDSRLEATLVSVLEHRPENCEIIVVHDGSYADSYEIGDEAQLIADTSSSTTTQLLNTAVQNARAEIVAVVMDGVTVSNGWSDAAVECLQDTAISSVAIRIDGPGEPAVGITPLARTTARSVLLGKVDVSLGSAQYAGPTLTCGLYRRRTLIQLGGWSERLPVEAADVELAWLLQSVGHICETVPGKQVALSSGSQRALTASSIRNLAELCVAYGITGSGFAAAASGWFTAASCGQFGRASAWAGGLMGGAITRSAITRLNLAQDIAEQETTAEPDTLPFSSHDHGPENLRRAA